MALFFAHIDFARRQINFDDRFLGSPNLNAQVYFSLDGVDCPIAEPRRPIDPAFYSHKLRRAALRYEVGVPLFGNRIVWVNGGVPAGAHPDLVLARQLVVQLLNPGEKVVADSGYRDPAVFINKILRPRTDTEKQYNTWIRRVLARHETVNARLKNFNVLRSAFHHGATAVARAALHQQCFMACANLTQMMLQRGNALMAPVELPNF